MYLAKGSFIFFQILILARSTLCDGVEWKYTGQTGPDKWSSLAPACGFSGQSPINIDTKGLLPDVELGLLQLDGYKQNLSLGDFSNNGHTVQLSFPKKKLFQLSGRGINGTYKALQLHFHWSGSGSTVGGSEHTVNGMHYDAEMHIVHIKDSLTMTQAKDLKDGLAVIGVFLKAESGANDNPYFQMLLETAQRVHYKGDKATLLNGPTLISLLPSTGSYYRYYGSLTTPPCYEAVLWTIYQQPIIISTKQFIIFQSFKAGFAQSKPQSIVANDTNKEEHPNTPNDQANEEELSDNYRPTQAINGRVVTAFYDIGLAKHVAETDNTWHYDGDKGPPHWSDSSPTCKGSKQSPIDLVTKSASVSDDLGKLKFSSSYFKGTSGKLENNGHTVKYSLSDDHDLEFWESKTKYQAKQVHFHWGKAVASGKNVMSVGGSEHTVDEKHYPIEMHIVHVKVASDDEDKNHHEDDLAVISVFFALEDEDHLQNEKSNEALNEITKLFDKVHYHGEETKVKDGPTLSSLLPSNHSYYRYMGSLTTPPCTESVMWSVFTHPVYVAKERFLDFQPLFKVRRSDVISMNSTDKVMTKLPSDTQTTLEKTLLIGNFRPTQEYNSRSVVVFIDNDIVAVPTGTDVVAIVLWTVGGLLVFAAVLALMICCRSKGDQSKESTVYRQVGTKPPHSAVESI